MQRKTQSRGLPTLSTDAGPFGPHRKPAGINAYILVAVSVAMLLAGGLVGESLSDGVHPSLAPSAHLTLLRGKPRCHLATAS